jgi:gamma-glutamyltranspeptidase
MFCLFYDAKTKKVSALNGSGRAPLANTLGSIRKDLGLESEEGCRIPIDHVHAATVPGAAAGWFDTVEQFGSGNLTLGQILTPAIEIGEKGFPISEIASSYVRDPHHCLAFGLMTDDLVVAYSGNSFASSLSKFQRDSQGRCKCS